MSETREQIEEEAIGWLIRLRDGGAPEWEQFVAWLEADPVRAEVYEEVALTDDLFGNLPGKGSRPAAAGDGSPAPRISRRAFAGWGMAAALVAALGYASLRPGDRPGDEVYAVATEPGERRSVTLRDGSRVELNGSTTILLDRERVRFARLEAGEALFTMAHDPTRPFRVEAGEAEVQVVGTVFNVVRADDVVEVAVAEGAVLFNPDREAVRLSPGMALRQSGGEVEVTRRDAGDIGGWRESRLSYSSETVARIAADLSRNIGTRVEASPDVGARRFSGVILLDADDEQLVRRVAALLGVEARRSGDGWLLTSDARAAR